MARTDTLGHFLTDVANSIRNKKGTTDTIIASNFDTEIDSIETGLGKYAPRYISFYQCQGTELDYEISTIDTSNIANMSNMFTNCSNLTSLDLSIFDTNNVINMSYMFSACSSLTSLDLSNFNTSNVNNMSSMFRNCSSLKSLNLSSFNTSSVTNMSSMFRNCSKLTNLNISNFDFTKVISYSNIFDNIPSNCEIIVKDDTSKEWVLTIRSDFINVKTVVEKEAEMVV